jgi:hypothetical protein
MAKGRGRADGWYLTDAGVRWLARLNGIDEDEALASWPHVEASESGLPTLVWPEGYRRTGDLEDSETGIASTHDESITLRVTSGKTLLKPEDAPNVVYTTEAPPEPG